jgi:hypothetical protein
MHQKITRITETRWEIGMGQLSQRRPIRITQGRTMAVMRVGDGRGQLGG